ncbi:MAG: DUF960 domain-containing protein [Candidatus Izimaplasma sp.]|nr:DUF960 domain-containing protein [Candidatus Izimaplasma bacterium]
MSEIKYTFDKENRYLTKGINQELPLELQVLLWSMVGHLVDSTTPTDYLQVFNFDMKDEVLIIKHSQEQPEYVKEHKVKMKQNYRSIVGRKVYIIDDIEHCTMLWSNEY